MQSNQLHLSSVLQTFQSYLAKIKTEIWLLSMTYHVFTCRDDRCMDWISCCKRKTHPKHPWFHSAHSSISSASALRYFQCQNTEWLTREPACVVANPALFRLVMSLIGGNVDYMLIFIEHSQVIGQSHARLWMGVILPLILAICWKTSTGPCWPHTFFFKWQVSFHLLKNKVKVHWNYKEYAYKKHKKLSTESRRA